MKYTFYPSGAVLCVSPHNAGAIAVMCSDEWLTPLQRADRARQQVDEILERLRANTEPQQPVLVEVHEAPCHRRESSD